MVAALLVGPCHFFLAWRLLFTAFDFTFFDLKREKREREREKERKKERMKMETKEERRRG